MKYANYFLVVFLFVSCDKYEISGDIIEDDDFLQELYAKSIDTLKHQSQQCILLTSLYRNFMPGVLPDANPLIANLKIREVDSLNIDNIFSM